MLIDALKIISLISGQSKYYLLVYTHVSVYLYLFVFHGLMLIEWNQPTSVISECKDTTYRCLLARIQVQQRKH